MRAGPWFWLIIYLISLSDSLEAQDQLKLYESWITEINQPIKVKGILYQVTDKSIIIQSGFKTTREAGDSVQSEEIEFDKIQHIKLNKKGKAVTGAVLGTLTGALVGAAIGWASDDGEELYSGGGVGLVLGGFAGLFFGTFIGLHAKHFRIDGKIENYNAYKAQLKGYSLHYQKSLPGAF